MQLLYSSSRPIRLCVQSILKRLEIFRDSETVRIYLDYSCQAIVSYLHLSLFLRFQLNF